MRPAANISPEAMLDATIDHWTLGLIQAREILTGEQQSGLFEEAREGGNFYNGKDLLRRTRDDIKVRQRALKIATDKKMITQDVVDSLKGEVRNVLNLYLQDVEFTNSHLVELMNGTMIGDHEIEFDRVGLTGGVGRFTCMTCGSTHVDHPLPSRIRNQRKFEFFKAHPHREIKDIGYQV
jgi:hypothetical protein